MSKIRYNKPPLSYLDQLNQLKDRGLIIENEEKALHLLANVSYYRLSGYWYPLLKDKEKHLFKKLDLRLQLLLIYIALIGNFEKL